MVPDAFGQLTSRVKRRNREPDSKPFRSLAMVRCMHLGNKSRYILQVEVFELGKYR